ncbi:hypothetical protein [Pigmentiphaga aceris]|nr:hypothetical protein [Pigmentiphaga aceris]
MLLMSVSVSVSVSVQVLQVSLAQVLLLGRLVPTRLHFQASRQTRSAA